MSQDEYFEAIRMGDVESLRSLIQKDPALLEERTNPDDAPERQIDCSGLHVAVYARQFESARVLVDAGIDVDAKTREGRTALHDSIEFYCDDIMKLLLERGAFVDICSAAILGKIERLRELLDGDSALANDRSTGLSPLGWAAFGNQVETARELIDRGARMDDGELLCAASVGHVEVGRFLIERGADPNGIHECSGCAALHAAAAMQYSGDSRRFIEMLLERGADIDKRTTQGQTALQIAEARLHKQNDEDGCENRNFEAVIAFLRERGASG